MARTLALLLVLFACGSGTASAGEPTPTRTGQVDLCYCALDEEQAAGCTYGGSPGTPPPYRQWRRQVEILGFDGETPAHQTFTQTIRNVTDDDDVYLRVRVSHPLRHAASVKVTQEDTPERPLLNFSGSPAPNLSGLLGVAQEAATTAKEATQAVEGEGQTRRRGDDESVPATVRTVEADALGKIVSVLSEISTDISKARASFIAALADEATAPSAIAALARQLPALRNRMDEADTLLSSIAPERRAKPGKSLDEVRAALTQLEASVASAADALAEGEMCLYLGRFAAGKTVHVAAKLEERPGPSALAARSSIDLRAAAEKATALLGGALEGAPARTHAKKDEDTSGSDKGNQKTATVDPLTYNFEVMKPVHVSAGFGFPVTWLDQKEYSLVAVPATDGDGTNGTPNGGGSTEQVKLVPQTEPLRVLPTFFLSVNVPPQYPSSTSDPDPYEGRCRSRLRRNGFSLHLGFPLSDIGKNYMFGVGFYVYPGVQIVGGVHIGKVTHLQEGWSENVAFEKPSADFDVEDATYERFATSGYVGLTIDSTAISKILGGGAR